MKKEQNVNALLENIKSLSKEEQSLISEQILKMLSLDDGKNVKTRASLVETNKNERPNCPYCGAKADQGWISKNGVNSGAQRYYCKHCNRRFFATTNTAIARTRKDVETWKKFIQMTTTGASLYACHVECHIAFQTAFTWRHKILNAFLQNQKDTLMNGVVEIDEMLMPISYKGNHIKGKFTGRRLEKGKDNGLPRESYKRGSDNKSTSSKNKACVFCMVEDGNKSFYASVPGVGFMQSYMLDATIGKHVDKNKALMLSDSCYTTRLYLEKNGYNHKILLSNTGIAGEHKPEIIGNFHLQHVNSMHYHLRAFLARYYGVSSKYLENYVALYVWLKSINQTKRHNNAEKASIARVATPDCYLTRKQIESRPDIPTCA